MLMALNMIVLAEKKYGKLVNRKIIATNLSTMLKYLDFLCRGDAKVRLWGICQGDLIVVEDIKVERF